MGIAIPFVRRPRKRFRLPRPRVAESLAIVLLMIDGTMCSMLGVLIRTGAPIRTDNVLWIMLVILALNCALLFWFGVRRA